LAALFAAAYVSPTRVTSKTSSTVHLREPWVWDVYAWIILKVAEALSTGTSVAPREAYLGQKGGDARNRWFKKKKGGQVGMRRAERGWWVVEAHLTSMGAGSVLLPGTDFFFEAFEAFSLATAAPTSPITLSITFLASTSARVRSGALDRPNA